MKFLCVLTVLAGFISVAAVQSEHGMLCETNVVNMKMDVVVLVEFTTSTYDSISELLSNLLTYVASLHIHNDGIRLALILYNTNPSVQYQFADDQSLLGFKTALIKATQNAPDTDVNNITAALEQADQLLKNSTTRKSRGIFLYAMHYGNSGPRHVAEDIKESGVKIATMNFGDHDQSIPILASPGLAMNSAFTNITQFDYVFSSLNCACPKTYTQLTIDNTSYSECFKYVESVAAPDFIICENFGIIATAYTSKRLDFITDTIIATTVTSPPKRLTIGLNRVNANSNWGWLNYYNSSVLPYTNYPAFNETPQADATWGYLENYSGLNWRMGSDNGDISYNYLCAVRASDA